MAIVDKFVTTTGAGAHDGTSEANAFSWTEALTDSNTAADGTRYNVKVGTYTQTTASQTTGAGSATGPLIFRGYSSTIGDGYLGRTGSNGALITTNMPLISYTTGRLTPGAFTIFESMQFNGAATTQGPLLMGSNQVTLRCAHTNTVNGVNGIGLNLNNGSNTVVLDCDIAQTGSSAGAGIGRPGGACKIIGNRIKSTSGEGIRISDSSHNSLFLFNTIFVNGTDGFTVSAAGACGILYNTIVGCSGDGIDMSVQGSLTLVMGNMITDNGGWAGTFGGAASAIVSAYNRTRDNTSGKFNNAADWIAATQYGDVTTDTGGSSTDYVDFGNQNYNLVATSAAISVGLPLFASMGAYQRSQTASLSPSPLITTLVQSRTTNG